jgi:short-subunit dehydrogenase
MLANGEEGHIVNTASMAGLLSAPALAAYNVSKFGVVTLSEGLHHDLTLRQTKLGVSVLCPSWVNTRIIESERNRDAAQRTDVDKLERISAKASANIMKAVQNGLSTEEVATQVMAAVQANQFYILTHPDSQAAVNVRAQDILQNRQPTLMPI